MQEKTNYYNEIKEILLKDESYSKVKDYSKERHRVITYFQVGKMLSDAGKHYGEDIIGNFSKKLIIDVDKKYSTTLLKRMRQFYILFQKSAPVAHLSWSHYQELLPIKNIKEINQNKTLGILIVKENNKYVIKYLYDKKIKSIEYQLI